MYQRKLKLDIFIKLKLFVAIHKNRSSSRLHNKIAQPLFGILQLSIGASLHASFASMPLAMANVLQLPQISHRMPYVKKEIQMTSLAIQQNATGSEKHCTSHIIKPKRLSSHSIHFTFNFKKFGLGGKRSNIFHFWVKIGNEFFKIPKYVVVHVGP